LAWPQKLVGVRIKRHRHRTHFPVPRLGDQRPQNLLVPTMDTIEVPDSSYRRAKPGWNILE
jgi:hypothetical protein